MLRETLNGAVVAGAAGAGVGFPRVSCQQHVSIVGYAVLLLAVVHRQQGAQRLVCGCTQVQAGLIMKILKGKGKTRGCVLGHVLASCLT